MPKPEGNVKFFVRQGLVVSVLDEVPVGTQTQITINRAYPNGETLYLSGDEVSWLALVLADVVKWRGQ